MSTIKLRKAEEKATEEVNDVLQPSVVSWWCACGSEEGEVRG